MALVMDDYKVEGSWMDDFKSEIFKANKVPSEHTGLPLKYSKESYDDAVKERLRESVWEYLDDEKMIDKFVTHLQDMLTENYKESNDKAFKIKSMMIKLFGNYTVF